MLSVDAATKADTRHLLEMRVLFGSILLFARFQDEKHAEPTVAASIATIYLSYH
jgi:hypothetical protein